MAIATVLSRAQCGMEASLVRVEVDIANGLPAFTIVGLPETVVKESKDRVRAALVNSNFELPPGRITVNLAPADIPKEGGRFDLPIAIGILAATGQLPSNELENCEFYGELSLNGALRAISGALPAAIAARGDRHSVMLPLANVEEALLVSACEVFAAGHLLDVCAHIAGRRRLFAQRASEQSVVANHGPDLAEVRGQAHAKRALEIAAAGEHNLLFIGPPGTGKSMLAQRLVGILPPMTEPEALEAAAVRSVLGRSFDTRNWRVRPFRAPHHTASAIALVGGGTQPRPGEISLAHNGVLFLDELPEFGRRVLEVLREPLEAGAIVISRAAQQAEFPARFQLLGAMNPCPCGYLGDSLAACRCSAEQVQRYRARVSGPLLDRLDMHVHVPRVTANALAAPAQATESSACVAGRVAAAREAQHRRQGCSNARLTNAKLDEYCQLQPRARSVLDRAMQSFALSARAYHRILKLARTIADLRSEAMISAECIGEAVMFRSLDKPTPTK